MKENMTITKKIKVKHLFPKDIESKKTETCVFDIDGCNAPKEKQKAFTKLLLPTNNDYMFIAYKQIDENTNNLVVMSNYYQSGYLGVIVRKDEERIKEILHNSEAYKLEIKSKTSIGQRKIRLIMTYVPKIVRPIDQLYEYIKNSKEEINRWEEFENERLL